MENIHLHPMKKIEVIIRGDLLKYLEEILNDSSVTGYTIVRDICGKGHHGFHGGRLIFNEKDSYIMLVAVASEESIERIIAQMGPFIHENSGVMFVSDTSVLRAGYFSKE